MDQQHLAENQDFIYSFAKGKYLTFPRLTLSIYIPPLNKEFYLYISFITNCTWSAVI